MDCCREVLAASNLEVDDLAAILLVGGSTRMPIVADTLFKEFGVPIRYAEDPGTAVVQGAANWSSTPPDRLIAPSPIDARDVPLRWDFPAGSGTLVRWLVETGAMMVRDQPMLLVRTVDGVLITLTCGESTGELADWHADAGDPIFAGQWLVTIRRPIDQLPVTVPFNVHLLKVNDIETRLRSVNDIRAVEEMLRQERTGKGRVRAVEALERRRSQL